jgi:hypothetical protein
MPIVPGDTTFNPESNVILQSSERFDEIAEYDLLTGNYRFLSKSCNREMLPVRIAGSYSRLGGTIVSLYRKNEHLFLSISKREFKITPDVYSSLTQEDDHQTFRLLNKQEVITMFTCTRPRSDIPAHLDPTPFVDDEDFDFLLFVHHVLTEEGRRERVYRN